MLESILSSTASVTTAQFLILSGVSLLLGFLSALVYMYRNSYTKGFAITLVLLPVVVQSLWRVLFHWFAFAPFLVARGRLRQSLQQWQSALQPAWDISALRCCSLPPFQE